MYEKATWPAATAQISQGAELKDNGQIGTAGLARDERGTGCGSRLASERQAAPSFQLGRYSSTTFRESLVHSLCIYRNQHNFADMKMWRQKNELR
jgi:hypothetical protein